MIFPLLILDGVLLLTFLVGCIEATAMSSYRWTWRRFLRAVSVPLAISAFAHWMIPYGFLPVLRVLLALPRWIADPLLIFIVGGFVLFGVPLGVLKLVDFVASQFDDATGEDLQTLRATDTELS